MWIVLVVIVVLVIGEASWRHFSDKLADRKLDAERKAYLAEHAQDVWEKREKKFGVLKGGLDPKPFDDLAEKMKRGDRS